MAKQETPKPDADSEVGKERVKLTQSNGVTQPRDGTKTRRVWDIADEISATKQRPAFRNEVMEQGKAEDMSPGTVATQYGKWCAFHGVTGDQLKKAREAEKPAEPEKAEETDAA